MYAQRELSIPETTYTVVALSEDAKWIFYFSDGKLFVYGSEETLESTNISSFRKILIYDFGKSSAANSVSISPSRKRILVGSTLLVSEVPFEKALKGFTRIGVFKFPYSNNSSINREIVWSDDEQYFVKANCIFSLSTLTQVDSLPGDFLLFEQNDAVLYFIKRPTQYNCKRGIFGELTDVNYYHLQEGDKSIESIDVFRKSSDGAISNYETLSLENEVVRVLYREVRWKLDGDLRIGGQKLYNNVWYSAWRYGDGRVEIECIDYVSYGKKPKTLYKIDQDFIDYSPSAKKVLFKKTINSTSDRGWGHKDTVTREAIILDSF